MSKIALIVNTISKNKDVWEMFFNKITEYVPQGFFDNKYVFVDEDYGEIPQDYKIVKYNTEKVYSEQFSECIQSVNEEFCIYVSEDYILYNNFQADKVLSFKQILMEDESLSFIRFMRGGIYDGPFEKYSDNLFYLPINQEYFYTNQAALWKTQHLKKIHEQGPKLHIANVDWQNSFEFQASKTCREMGLKGLFCYYNEKKRGLYHYDSQVFPHVSTALVKGKWNLSGYPKEMEKLIKEFKIKVTNRGWV